MRPPDSPADEILEREKGLQRREFRTTLLCGVPWLLALAAVFYLRSRRAT